MSKSVTRIEPVQCSKCKVTKPGSSFRIYTRICFECTSAAQKAKWANNPELYAAHLAAPRKSYDHLPQYKAKKRAYREANKDKIKAQKLHRKQLLETCEVNDFTKQQWFDLLREFHGRCAYCNMRGQLTADHRVPVSLGGNHTRSNIVPACASCNSSKSDKLVVAWLRARIAAEPKQVPLWAEAA